MTKLDDVEGWINYLCKGGGKDCPPDVRYNEGHLLDGRHDVWWIKHEEIKALQSQNSKKRKIENVLDTCYQDIVDDIDARTGNSNLGARILEWYYDEGKRIPSRFAMETMMGTIRLRLNALAPEGRKKTYAEMFNELYPMR